MLLAESARGVYEEFALAVRGPQGEKCLDALRILLDQHLPPGKAWIWQGEGFAVPEGVVFSAPFMDLRPFVCSLPLDMLGFRYIQFCDFKLNAFSQCISSYSAVQYLVRSVFACF